VRHEELHARQAQDLVQESSFATTEEVAAAQDV